MPLASVLKNFLYSFFNAFGNDRTAGVSISVIKVLKPRPHTIETARFDHQSTTLLPMTISLEMMSTLVPIARGNKPKIVVSDVNIIGLNLCLHALMI